MNDRAGFVDLQISVDPALCTGCRACELACGLRHSGSMRPAAASIRISRSDRTAALGWEVDGTCDLCAGEERPLCVRYCATGAVRAGRHAPVGPEVRR
jgi:Fe-S-cluster-containing hydrogenase component 2